MEGEEVEVIKAEKKLEEEDKEEKVEVMENELKVVVVMELKLILE